MSAIHWEVYIFIRYLQKYYDLAKSDLPIYYYLGRCTCAVSYQEVCIYNPQSWTTGLKDQFQKKIPNSGKQKTRTVQKYMAEKSYWNDNRYSHDWLYQISLDERTFFLFLFLDIYNQKTFLRYIFLDFCENGDIQ